MLALAPDPLRGHPLHQAPACTHSTFSCLVTMPSVWRAQGPPQPVPTSALAVPRALHLHSPDPGHSAGAPCWLYTGWGTLLAVHSLGHPAGCTQPGAPCRLYTAWGTRVDTHFSHPARVPAARGASGLSQPTAISGHPAREPLLRGPRDPSSHWPELRPVSQHHQTHSLPRG